MYDLFTSTVLFFLLVPGTILTLPPGSSAYVAALVHAAVFFVVQTYLPNYVPSWGIWIIGAAVLAIRVFMGYRSAAAAASPLGLGGPAFGGRRR